MSTMDTYYRAYRDYINRVGHTYDYINLTKALQSQDGSKDTFTGSMTHREIDMDWVEAIEFALPYMDKAIREQRRFIEQTEEVVPIEKSKKITTESVRHLAQHTSMIGRIENDSVIPKSILNIQREESFGIYENRFLKTLVNRAIEFVEMRYNAIRKDPETAVAHITMQRNVNLPHNGFNVNLDCALEYAEEVNDFSVNDDVSGLSGFERILRLRLILSDFLSAPLMRALSGTPEVRGTITRTNLLTKNINFRESLNLWVFLEGYTKTGFNMITAEGTGVMTKDLQYGLYDVYTFMQFAVRLNMSPELKESYEREYQRVLAKEADEKAKAEALLRDNIESTVRNECKIEIDTLKTAAEEQKTAYEKHISELTTAFQTKVNELNVNYTSQLKEAKANYDTVVNAYENKIQTINNENVLTINRMNFTSQQELKNCKEMYYQIINEKETKYKADLEDLEIKYNNSLESLKTQFSEDVIRVKEEYAEKLNSLKASSENEQKEEIKAVSKDRETELKQEIKRITKLAENYYSRLESKELERQKLEKQVVELNKKLSRLSGNS